MEPQRLPFAKAFDTPFISLEETNIEMGSILFLFLLVVIITQVHKHRQIVRHVVQLISFLVFFFFVYSCLGVFGMIRNGLYGATLIGTVYSESFYWMALPVVVLSVTLLTGPIFCGWICPTGTIQEVAAVFRRLLTNNFRRSLFASVPALAAFGALALGWSTVAAALFMLSALTALIVNELPGSRAVKTPRRANTVRLVLLGMALAGFVTLTIWISLEKHMFIEDSSLHWSAALILVCYLVILGVIDDLPTRSLRVVSVIAIVVTAVSHVTITSPVHFAFTSRDDPASALSTLVIACASLVVARSWCRYLCPWGYLMGFLNRFSRLKIVRSESLCVHCDTCSDSCDVAAIDSTGVHYQHCQLCYACVDKCPEGALEVVNAWTGDGGTNAGKAAYGPGTEAEQATEVAVAENTEGKIELKIR